MKNNLLNKPLKVFALYALLVLLISTPVYFLTIQYIWFSELDEHNQNVKENVVANFKDLQIDEDNVSSFISLWNNMSGSNYLEVYNGTEILPDSIYTAEKQSIHSNEVIRYRALKSLVSINGKPYVLTIETNVEESDETFFAIALITFFFFIILIVGFIVLNKRLSKELWQPFQNTLQKIKSYDLSKQVNIELASSGIAEFDELNAEVDKMVKKNLEVYTQQKQFIENASHELQTPLAVLKSKMDMLIQHENLGANQANFIQELEMPIARISQINKNMLLLAKIENNQFIENTVIDVGALISKYEEFLSDFAKQKELELINFITQSIQVNANAFLIETLIQNVLVNAITYTEAKGKIIIYFEENTLCFCNSGKEAIPKDSLFNRFSNKGVNKAGSGLGLSIVKQIIDLYNWQISYSFNKEMHTFSIQFT